MSLSRVFNQKSALLEDVDLLLNGKELFGVFHIRTAKKMARPGTLHSFRKRSGGGIYCVQRYGFCLKFSNVGLKKYIFYVFQVENDTPALQNHDLFHMNLEGEDSSDSPRDTQTVCHRIDRRCPWDEGQLFQEYKNGIFIPGIFALSLHRQTDNELTLSFG